MTIESRPLEPRMICQSPMLTLACSAEGISLSSPLCPEFLVGPLRPLLTVNGQTLSGAEVHVVSHDSASAELLWSFGANALELKQRFRLSESGGLHLVSELNNLSGAAIQLNALRLLAGDTALGTSYALGGHSAELGIYEQSNYRAEVRRPSQKRVMAGGVEEDPTQRAASGGDSQHCWVSYAPSVPFAWLAGFATSTRWDGRIQTSEDAQGSVSHWQIGFDGGDVLIDAGQTVPLEEVLLLAGDKPYDLLELYGDTVAQRHDVKVLPYSPVSWCSWYPYRLGVTEDRVLANARLAQQRLKSLGLKIFQIDLGWEKEYLPTCYEANDQFAHGFLWLRDQLGELGFRLGLWQGVFTVSVFDEVAKEHPEWLLGDGVNKPVPLGTWFWKPHGEYYALDLTHPGAQEWLRTKFRSLLEQGASYFKLDFISMVTLPNLRQRHDPRMVAGGGNEAARLGMNILMEEAARFSDEPLLLNCGMADLPGPGSFPLNYVCQDTGNTGYTSFRFLRDDYGKYLAGHLWKQGRWGVIQPSCLCVGLPGPIEEARVRATATFMCGGQVDIGDDLTRLPEERWQILLSTLPPTGHAARPIDLFDPISCTSLSYEAVCRSESEGGEALASTDDCSRVWHLSVATDWDEWELVALFDYDVPAHGAGAADLITNFQLPLERIKLSPDESYWGFEFWSGQFLGSLPPEAEPNSLVPQGYVHPGDAAGLTTLRKPGLLQVSFFGPGVKLISFRKARLHPWPVGTSFHQSGGTELGNVVWKELGAGGTLRGELHRPTGQQGDLYIAGAKQPPTRVTVVGLSASWRYGANDVIIVSLVTWADSTAWEVVWDDADTDS
jgi:hypothetical protein